MTTHHRAGFGRVVLLLGATGLVGGELLRQLLADPGVARIVALVRRQVALPAGTPAEHAAKFDARLVDFERLEAHGDAFAGVTQVFCALGTTIRQAGSQARFRRVDHDYPLAAARLGLERGATHYLLVSAVGADPSSRIFYNRVKGEVERAVGGLGYRSVTIVRPSLLLGERQGFRPGEELAKRLAWLIPRRWAPIHASAVAAAMIRAAHEDRSGTRIIESAAMQPA